MVTGGRTRQPALWYCSVDHHHLALRALERAVELGYQRPGLVLDDVIDALIERRFTAGFSTGQRALAQSQRVPVFAERALGEEALVGFHEWMDAYRPDVIFTLYNNVLNWLGRDGMTVPKDVGVAQLEWSAARPDIAGMNQHNFAVGEAAVDMVISQIHNNETGVNDFPRATLIGATWIDGASVPGLIQRAEARRVTSKC